MGFGIREPRDPNPPGTSLLERVTDLGENHLLVLIPKPSKSPNDPLNWSRLRKELFFLTTVYGVILTGVIGPVLVPGFVTVAEHFHVGLTQISLLNGSLIMGLGVSAYLCSCLAPLCGKRLIYLFTTILSIVSCIWAAAARNYTSLLISRVFQGLSMGSFFGLAGTITINDLWFVHERGFRAGIWNMAGIASINVAPIISGYVITGLGWRWSFWILAICYGTLLVLVIFLMPETSFQRTDIEIADPPEAQDHEECHDSNGTEKTARAELTDTNIGTAAVLPSKWKTISGLETMSMPGFGQTLTSLLQPILLLRAPAVLWSCAMWSVCFSWLILQASVAQQIFGAAPYNLNSIQVGIFIGCAPLTGAVLGTLIAGILSDFIAKTMAIRNNGIYEPEFRLLIMIPFLVVWCTGIFGLGASLAHEMSLTVCGVFLAILNFGVGVGCTGVVTYTNDVCRKHAAESFGITMMVKSAFAFGLTFMVNDYYVSAGPMNFMWTWGFLCVGVTFLTLPLYIFGKMMRAWTNAHHIL